MLTQKESDLMDFVISWCKERGLERDDALALILCCRGNVASQEMIDLLRENPDIDYSDLLLKAVEIHKRTNGN